MRITERTLLAEAKQWLRDSWSEKRPIKCPCCTRNVQLREYSMTADTIEILQELWDRFGATEVFHLPTQVTAISMEKSGKPGRNGDVSMVRHWGLIQKVGKNVVVLVGGSEVAGTQIADYVLDPSLEQFLSGDLAVPAWVQMFDGHVIDTSPELVTADQFRLVDVEVEEVEENSE